MKRFLLLGISSLLAFSMAMGSIPAAAASESTDSVKFDF